MGSRGAHPLLPWPGRLVFAILFSIGIVGVALATQVVVPLVLGVLSLFVAPRALIAASVSVRRAGHSAIDGMRLARQWLMDAQEDPREPGAQRVDVPSASPGVRGVRIETPDEMSADEEASADAPETESAGRERRR